MTRPEALDLLLNVFGKVGHELRNPLAPLANSLEILKFPGADAARIDATRLMMERQLRVLSRLVDDLMDLPRLAHGKMFLRRNRIDLAALLRSCGEDRRNALVTSGLTLEMDVPTCPVWVVGDETRLTQVIGNLISNAQKFTDRGGSVTLRLTVSEGMRATITVTDTGTGIEPAALTKVFEAYVQADQALDRRRGGLGLGLALVKGVIELHGGTVEAASGGIGRGATFTVSLPAFSTAELRPDATQPTSPSPQKTRKVLIIEDNRDSAESLRTLLEFQGHIVQVAHSGLTGVQLAATCPPEVVICDVGLPGMDGYAVAAALRRLSVPPHLIVAVTGHGGRKDSSGEPDQVFDYYLLKPVQPDRILRLLAADLITSERE